MKSEVRVKLRATESLPSTEITLMVILPIKKRKKERQMKQTNEKHTENLSQGVESLDYQFLSSVLDPEPT